MDAVIIILLGLYFCLRKVKSKPEDMVIDVPSYVQEVAQIPIGLNENFYEEEHAFEEVAHGLNFH